MPTQNAQDVSSPGGGSAVRGALAHVGVRAVLAAWVLAVVFVFCLQQNLHRHIGDGCVGRALDDLNGWVCRYTAPPTTFEPEP